MVAHEPSEPVLVEPIAAGDLDLVGRFLHDHLDARLSSQDWTKAITPPWAAVGNDHGFLLRQGTAVVGVYLAFHSEREIGGRRRSVCNLGAWCVLESHRAHAPRLLRAQLARRGVVLTDLSPSGNVLVLNRRLGFTDLDTTTALAPCLPLPTPGVRVVTRPDRVEQLLPARDLELYRDHRTAAAVHHVVLVVRGEPCYVMVRKVRRRGLPVFAVVLHTGAPGLLRRGYLALERHLLLRHGVLALLVELRTVGHAPPLSGRLRTPRPKMFRGEGVAPEDIDDLYSELTCVPW
ncbi:hypothetical protein [Nocardioides sp. T2.26MG-1]|uniref:hypothetical protein n=1 Tax=Nocardioides sp. T2.26MG-1 TaxID=3041166 RepID=UPI002477BF87|nr:hypothetical protein [Nocardioides sp. T2.26MG-1]CAI9398642.1 hypothetical protein HIDPHFAB_00037 [Nocardioides sp. T2.26MG-1]